MKQVTFFLKHKVHIRITELMLIIFATLIKKTGSFIPLFSEFNLSLITCLEIKQYLMLLLLVPQHGFQNYIYNLSQLAINLIYCQ